MGLIGKIHDLATRLPLREQLRNILLALKKPIHEHRLQEYAAAQSRPTGKPAVLVLMNTGIGNAVEATPLVQAIRMHWPRSFITVYDPGGDLFDDWCVPDEITCYPDPLAGRVFDHSFEIWSVNPPIPESDSYPDKGRVHRLPFTGTYFLKPEREYNLDMIRKLGYRGPAPPLYVSMKRPAVGLPEGRPRLCLVPGSKTDFMWRHKRWPYFADLLSDLLQEYPEGHVGIIGGAGDRFDNPHPDDRRVVDLRGRLSLSQTAWVLRHSDLAIGNDCGPMHIADAVQTRSIILFGPSCELKNGPINKAVPLSVPVSCRPCQYGELLMTCEDPRCMNELSPDLVMEKVREMLAGPATQSGVGRE